jgi:hypothetical protein
MEVKLVSGVILFFGTLTAIEIILQRAELFFRFVAAFSQSTKRVLGKRHRPRANFITKPRGRRMSSSSRTVPARDRDRKLEARRDRCASRNGWTSLTR